MNDLVALAMYLRKHFLVFALACSALFLGSAYYYHTNTFYSSRITFLVNSSSFAEILWDRANDGPMDVFNDDKGYNRINQIMYSSDMIDYLIERFDLYNHYRIKKENPNSYLIVSGILKDHMKVTISKTKIISVEVTDRLDYNVASNMANAIGKKINDINRHITLENLSRKTDIFESLSKDLRSNSQREFSQMDSLLKRLEHFISTSIPDASSRQLLMLTLENMQSKSDDYFHDLFESYKYRLYSMYSLQEKNLPTISVLEKALPDEGSKSRYNWTVYPLLFVFSILVPGFMAYVIMKIRPRLSYVVRNAGRQNLPE